MPSRSDEAVPRIVALRREAAAERRCAVLAAWAAARHESLAAAAPSGLRDLHAAASGLHREAEAMHLAVAGIADTHAALLDGWLGDPNPGAARPRLVAVVAAVLGTPSASAMLWVGGRAAARLSASDDAARAACEAESLGAHGPATEAWSAGRPCAAAGRDLGDRWPLFGQTMAGLGLRAAIAAPLGFPAARLGAVCAYYREATVSEAAVTAASQVASAVTRLLLNGAQRLGPALIARDSDLAVVHQAAGMISAQAGCRVEDARDLLAARAYADGVPLAQAAAGVLRGSIRFGRGHQQAPGQDGSTEPPASLRREGRKADGFRSTPVRIAWA